MPPLPGRAAFIGDDLAAAAALGIADVNPPALVQALDRPARAQDGLRSRLPRRGQSPRGRRARRAAPALPGADKTELELHLAFLGATRQDDAETPYKNIVALGKHAATLHHISYEKRAQPAQSLLVDAAASFAGYCADVTRTWVKGRAARREAPSRSWSRAWRRCSSGSARRWRSGMPLRAAPRRVAPAGGRHPARGRASRGSPATSWSPRGVTRAFYPARARARARAAVPRRGLRAAAAEEGQPLPAQHLRDRRRPGLHHRARHLLHRGACSRRCAARPDIDWKLVDALSPFGGVRIEDDLVVGGRGIRNLTREVLPQGGGAP